MQHPEHIKQVTAFYATDISGGASGKWIHAANARHISFLISIGATLAGAAAVTLEQATDNTGSGAKSAPLRHAYSDKTTDGMFVREDVSGDSYAGMDTASKSYIVGIESHSLDTNNGYEWVRVTMGDPGGPSTAAIIATLWPLRYEAESDRVPNVL